jgi:ABC-type multidrug transport system permease subunit
MPINLILLIAALLVSFLVFRWLFSVIKSTATTALIIAIIVLLLQFVFGIDSQDLWEEIINLPQTFQEIFKR